MCVYRSGYIVLKAIVIEEALHCTCVVCVRLYTVHVCVVIQRTCTVCLRQCTVHVLCMYVTLHCTYAVCGWGYTLYMCFVCGYTLYMYCVYENTLYMCVWGYTLHMCGMWVKLCTVHVWCVSGDITLPPRVQEAMQMQVEAERKKRAAILQSEGQLSLWAHIDNNFFPRGFSILRTKYDLSILLLN